MRTSDLNKIFDDARQRNRRFVIINKQLQRDLLHSIHFTTDARRIFGNFYDERLKVRRKIVPKFCLYASFGEGTSSSEWTSRVHEAEAAIKHLITLGYIVRIPGEDPLLQKFVGQGAESYELTAEGSEILQALHPALALRLKAWIAVMPPWLVLVGSISGGIAAAWKFIDAVLKFIVQ
jgi:hypothetical protein